MYFASTKIPFFAVEKRQKISTATESITHICGSYGCYTVSCLQNDALDPFIPIAAMWLGCKKEEVRKGGKGRKKGKELHKRTVDTRLERFACSASWY